MGFMRPQLTARIFRHAASTLAESSVPAQQPPGRSDATNCAPAHPSAIDEAVRLIAAGEERLPTDAPSGVSDDQIAAVQRAGRQVLVGFIARQLAIAIQRRREETPQE